MQLTDKLKSLIPLDLAVEDECCGKALGKALASGVLAKTDTWVHAKCGCVWKARVLENGGRCWYPNVEIWVI